MMMPARTTRKDLTEFLGVTSRRMLDLIAAGVVVESRRARLRCRTEGVEDRYIAFALRQPADLEELLAVIDRAERRIAAAIDAIDPGAPEAGIAEAERLIEALDEGLATGLARRSEHERRHLGAVRAAVVANARSRYALARSFEHSSASATAHPVGGHQREHRSTSPSP